MALDDEGAEAEIIRSLLEMTRAAEDQFLEMRRRLRETASRGRSDKAGLEQAVKRILAVVLADEPKDISVVNNALHGFHVWRPGRLKEWLEHNGYRLNPTGSSYVVSLAERTRMVDTKRGNESDLPTRKRPIVNQMAFISEQCELVAGRLEASGLDELARGMREVANTVTFFSEEYAGQSVEISASKR